MAEGNWILVKVPRGSDFTRNACSLIWEPNGLYMQPEVSHDLLKEILAINGEKLKNIAAKSEIYGKYSLSGMHPEYDKGYEPLPNQHLFLRE